VWKKVLYGYSQWCPVGYRRMQRIKRSKAKRMKE
jgi:hypothetical protein